LSKGLARAMGILLSFIIDIRILGTSVAHQWQRMFITDVPPD
jgi:hypothetical protein